MNRAMRGLLTAGVTAFGLAACGGGDGADPTPTQAIPDAATDVSGGAGVASLSVPADAVPGKAVTDAQGRRLYAVILTDDPAVAYKGDRRGFAKTRPAEGARFNAKSTAVRAYRGYLKARQDSLLQSVGGGRTLYQYTVAVNGFAAWLTPQQVRALEAHSQVRAVTPNRILRPSTNNSGRFIKLDGPGVGFHAKGIKGEDVIIGVIDTGIWPEHPSFADDGSYGPPPDHWRVALNEPGSCEFGNTAWNATDDAFECNNKLLAARFFYEGIGGQSALAPDLTYESARDDDGHGSNIAGIAAGNEDVPASIGGRSIGRVSGIAPRARVAVYKACWNGSEPPAGFIGGCSTVDTAAAIDQAVADGVDVINYSIGSDTTTFGGPEDFGFLFAKDAGVWVVTSAGNGGPDAGTIGTPAGLPWITSVGASQDDGVEAQAIRISAPESVRGLYEATEGSSPVTLASLGLVAGDLRMPADPANREGCEPVADELDGYIALIERGGCTFAQKSANAEAAGAIMMYVYTDDRAVTVMSGLEDAGIPSVMFRREDGLLFVKALTDGVAVSSRADANETVNKQYTMASFSARGPNVGLPDIMKPDISAPGVEIQAAVTPFPIDGPYVGGIDGDLFGTLSGTSQASPHVAGVFALLREAHPFLTPGQGKSVIMQKARPGLVDTFGDPANFFDTGSGNLRGKDQLPLVLDTDLFEDYATICGAPTQPGLADAEFCSALATLGYSLDPTDYNIASITDSAVAGSGSTSRTLTNVTNVTHTFRAWKQRPPGYRIGISPRTFTLRPGESVQLAIRYENDGAPTGRWREGTINYRSDDGSVRGQIPILLRGEAFSAPAEVRETGAGASGSGRYTVGFGYDGSFEVRSHGLAPAERSDDTVVDDPLNDINEALDSGVGINTREFSIPPDTVLARFALFDDDTDGEDDLDLYIFEEDGSFCCSSAGNTSEEVVTIEMPAAGAYTVVVHGYETDGPDANYTLFGWSVTPRGWKNFSASAPTSAANGTTAEVDYSWNDLLPGEKYLGLIENLAGETQVDTIVNVWTE
jgi:subtilisin family serine protease